MASVERRENYEKIKSAGQEGILRFMQEENRKALKGDLDMPYPEAGTGSGSRTGGFDAISYAAKRHAEVMDVEDLGSSATSKKVKTGETGLLKDKADATLLVPLPPQIPSSITKSSPLSPAHPIPKWPHPIPQRRHPAWKRSRSSSISTLMTGKSTNILCGHEGAPEEPGSALQNRCGK